MDLSKAFVVEHGFSINDLVAIVTGVDDPTLFGEDAPLGSLYLRQNGLLYTKIGLGTTDWIVMSQGAGEAVKVSATDTVSGFLGQKIDVSAELTKTVVDPGGNEELLLDLSNTGVSAGTYRQVTVSAKGRVTAGSNPTTLAGYGIVDAQPLDADLTSLAALNSIGYVVRTAANTFAVRSISGATNQIVVLNGSGVAPTELQLAPNLVMPGSAGFVPPSGVTGDRVDTAGSLRFNTQTGFLEYYNSSQWIELAASTGGTVTSVAASTAGDGLQITGSPITTAGTLTFDLANDLAAVEGLIGFGFAARTAADTWGTFTLTGTADRLTVSNGAGGGDPVFDIAATYAGQTSINTVGTVTTGTWSAGTIGTQYGGTGRTTIGGANQVLAVNTTVTGLEYKTVQAGGAGISINAGAGVITVSNTGVTSVIGTANQVLASASTGAVTLSLPQDIGLTSSPTFSSVFVDADPTAPLQLATKQYVDGLITGVEYRSPVRVATTSDISLSGGGNIDGVSLNSGDRVLVKNQNSPSENGVYISGPGSWSRAADLDTFEEHVNAYVFVEEGDTNQNTSWICTSPSGGALGSDPITWELFSRAGDIIAGTGLSKTGNIIGIADTGVTIGTYNNVTVNAQGQVTVGANQPYLTGNQAITLQGDVTGTGSTLINTTLSNTGVSAGTYTSVTVDTKGRVTAATNPTTLAGYGITDAQPLDANLTSLSNLATTGFMVQTPGDVVLTRSLEAGSSKLSIVNPDAVSGNPVLDVVEANLTLNNIGGALGVAKGGTGLTAAGSPNFVLGVQAGGGTLEYKQLTGTGITITHSAGGVNFATVNNGTVTSVAITGSTGLTVGGSPITGAGTITLTLGAQLQGLSALSANGIVTRTASGTYASRSITSPAGTLTITNPAGTAGNVGVDLINLGGAGTYRSVTVDNFGRVTAGTNPTTLAGYGITDAVNVSQLGAANGVATLDGSGKLPLSQLPAIAVNDTFVVASEAAQLALTAQIGDIAVRTDIGANFVLASEPASVLGNWVQLAQSGGTVTSVGAVQPAAGLTITGGPITSSGSFTFALADDLLALENVATTGIAVRTAANSWTTRTLVAGTGISITNANGVAGNITVSATNTGTVTSVGLSAPSIFTVTGSPVTTAGTLSLALANQNAATFFAGPVSGGPAVPTFRTVALDELSDVVITTPTANQVVAYNGTNWVNTGSVGTAANGLVGVGQAGAAAWTLVSGSTYRADFTHNLGTTNVVITVFDSSTNAVVIPDLTTLINANTVRIQVIGNTRTLRVVVVANGQAIVAGGSTPSSVIVAKDGVDVATATRVNFTGQAVGVTNSGGGTVTVGVGARFTYFANSLDTPVNSDFAINALAPAITDPTYPSLNVRSFSNTVEQGVACTLSIPPGMTNVTFKLRGRPTTAPGVASVVQFRLYHRRLPNNAAVAAWSGAQDLANIAIPTNANFQYFTQTVALSALGLFADSLYQFEFTRRVAGVTGTNLANAFLLGELTVEFS